MEMKWTQDVNLRNVQEQMEDNLQHARRVAHRATLAYVGLWGMAYDVAKSGYEQGVILVEKAEHRGETIEHEFSDCMVRTSDEARKLRTKVEETVDNTAKDLAENRRSLEQEVEKILSRVRVPGVNIRVETEVIDVRAGNGSKLPEPFEGYDEMAAKEIVDQLGGMDEAALKTTRAYEAAHKNRVTILREIDERLTAMEPVAA